MQMWRGVWHVGPGLLGFGLGHAKPSGMDVWLRAIKISYAPRHHHHRHPVSTH